MAALCKLMGAAGWRKM